MAEAIVRRLSARPAKRVSLVSSGDEINGDEGFGRDSLVEAGASHEISDVADFNPEAPRDMVNKDQPAVGSGGGNASTEVARAR